MRTTVNIDDDLLAEAKEVAARERVTVSDLVQDALRVSVARARAARTDAQPLMELPTFGDPGEQPLVDLLDKDALAEAMGDNEPPWHIF